MAWPFTPTTTYLASSTPAIKASDLNNFQSAINTVYNTIFPTQAAPSVYTPQLLLKDTGGNVRGIVDHNGLFTNGNVAVFEECWVNGGVPLLSTPGAHIPISSAYPRWYCYLDAAANGGLTDYFGGANYPLNAAQIITNGTAPGSTALYSNCSVSIPTFTGLSSVQEWDAGLNPNATGGSGSGNIAYMGLDGTGGSSNLGNSTSYIRFEGSYAGNWICAALGASGGRQTVNTGISVPTQNDPITRFRLEYHGSTSPIGILNGAATALFFINGSLVGTLTSAGTPKLPTGNQSLAFGVNEPSSSSECVLSLGVVRASWNRFLAPTPVV
jgi:hypothetical protein